MAKGRCKMASYLMLFHFTERGIEKVHESPARVDAAQNLCRELGREVKQCYGLLGRYDTMFILDAPNDATAARISAAIGRLGNVRSETLRAFSEDEYRRIFSTLPR